MPLSPVKIAPRTTIPPPVPVANDNPEDNHGSSACAVHGLGESKAVGIIRNPDLAVERGTQVLVERVANQDSRVSIFDESRCRRNSARRTDTDGTRSSEFFFDGRNKSDDSLDR